MPSPYDVISNAMAGANNPPPAATNGQVQVQTGKTPDRSKDPAFQAKLARAQADQAAYEAAQKKKSARNYLTKPPGS